MVEAAINTNNKANVFQSQYSAGVAMFLASIINGTLRGWATASLPVLNSNESPIEMNVDRTSWVMSQQFFGTMVSAIPAGLLFDRYGSKKPVIYLGLLLPLPSIILIYVANDWRTLLISRFISGIWVGAVDTIAPMYLSEISSSGTHGFMNTMYNVSYRIGNIYALITALFVSYHNLPIFYSLSIVIFIFIIPFIPESPHYHIRRDDKKSATKSLLCLRNHKNDEEIETELKELEDSIRKQMENPCRFIDLILMKDNRKAFLIVETLASLQKLAGLVSIISYLSVTLPKSIIEQPMILVIIIEIIRFLASLISSLIIDRSSSRNLLLTTSLLCGTMMVVTGLWYYLDSQTALDVSHYNWVPFVCISVHGVSFTFGTNCICHNISHIISERLPINIKGKSSAITCSITSLVSFLVSKMYLIIDHEFGVYINFWIYAFSSFVLAIFANRYFVETNGKSHQQVQHGLNKSKNNNSYL